MGKRGRGHARAKASSSGVMLVAQGKGLVKRTQQTPFDPAGGDETEYAVREIKAERVKGTTAQWLVGWTGFSDKEDTWEPIEHLAGYEAELREFRDRKREEVEKADGEAAAKKRKREEEEAARILEDDGFEDSLGGKRRSPVWRHFRIQKDEQGKVVFVRCCLCPPESRSMPYRGNTTNLKFHLTSCHKDEYCKILSDNPSCEAGESVAANSSQSTLEALVPQLSVEGKERLKLSLKALKTEGILPSIGGDIWSQGGISIFGILVYWLDESFEVHEGLLGALPFSSVRHTALELEKATKEACADFGIGEYNALVEDHVDTVPDAIHATVSNNASNIVSGWESFDGHECCDHTLALIVHSFLGQTNVKKVAVQMYVDVESPLKASNAAPNPDGNIYRQHQLMLHEWDIVREAMYILRFFNHMQDCKLEDFAVATLLDTGPKAQGFQVQVRGKMDA
eukprot:gene26457-biopygen27397